MQVGLSCAWTTPSVSRTVFVPCQPEGTLHSLSCGVFQSFGRESPDETSKPLNFCKGDPQAGLAGCGMWAPLPHRERGLAGLLMVIVNRQTSIWYLLETFQSLLKPHCFCSLVPLALWVLNPFEGESTRPLEPMVSVAKDWDSKGLTRWKLFI